MKKFDRFSGADGRTAALTLIGCVIFGVSFSFFTYPNHIVSGGFTGVAQIINLLTGFPVGTLVIIMNVPLFVAALKRLGMRFLFFSLIGMIFSNLVIDFFNLFGVCLTNDILLAAVYGGLLKGLGFGLIFSCGGATGGTDILSKLLHRKYAYIPLGTIGLILDVAVIAAFAILFQRADAAMYAAITMFVSSRVVNLILYGTDNSGICYVITTYPHEIAFLIHNQLSRGATLLKGEGAYNGDERDVVLCAVKRHQMPALKRIVSEIDSHAFVIVTQSHEVFGKNFQDIGKID